MRLPKYSIYRVKWKAYRIKHGFCRIRLSLSNGLVFIYQTLEIRFLVERNNRKTIIDGIPLTAVYQVRFMSQSSPTVVAAYAHHAVIQEEIYRMFRLRIGEVTVIGLFGTGRAVFERVAAIQAFQRIVGHVHFKSAVGYKQQAFLRLVGEGAPIDVRAVVVFLRADIRLVHVFDARRVFADKL